MKHEEAHVCTQLLWFLFLCSSDTHISHSFASQYPWLVMQHAKNIKRMHRRDSSSHRIYFVKDSFHDEVENCYEKWATRRRGNREGFGGFTPINTRFYTVCSAHIGNHL